MIDNPFDQGPQSNAKIKFGVLSVAANPVELKAGESYTIPGLTGKDGMPWVFKGKHLTTPDKTRNRHIVLMLVSTTKDGNEYTAFRDFMYWQSDAVCKITYPSLQQAFGLKLERIWQKHAEVQIEEIEVQDGSYTRSAWRVVKVFATHDERVAAEKAHFAAFDNGSQPATTGVAPDGLPAHVVKFAADIAKQYAELLGQTKDHTAAVAKLATDWGATAQQIEAVLTPS